ncbi:hypothetical protein GCM10028805_37850 [Spirosoma harenae]
MFDYQSFFLINTDYGYNVRLYSSEEVVSEKAIEKAYELAEKKFVEHRDIEISPPGGVWTWYYEEECIDVLQGSYGIVYMDVWVHFDDLLPITDLEERRKAFALKWGGSW